MLTNYVIIKLYDSNSYSQDGKLKLQYHDSFQDRLEFLNKNLFDIDRYKRFYCKFTTENSDRKYVDYWFGVKPVGHMQKVETVKNTLDYLSGYLLNARDFDTNRIKKRYLELLEKEHYSTITNDESNELEELSKLVIYRKPSRSYKMSKNLIFMVNAVYEAFIESKSETLSNQLNTIKLIVKNNVALLNELSTMKKTLSEEITELYQSSKSENVNKEIKVKIISNNINKIKEINNDILYIRNTIEELYSDYYYIAENKVLK